MDETKLTSIEHRVVSIPNVNIKILPENIIDQIKAGEVVERPSTLIKEIIENSIDARSTQIDIEIHGNGMDLIVIKDNGKGMTHDDLELAFLRHATSKIQRFEDIYRLNSFGFRGEALASIASISQITCISNTLNSPESTIKISGAKIESHIQSNEKKENSKTEIYIKDLFFNTPVRMKFLRSQGAERNNIKKVINAFLLTHPDILFKVKWEDKPKRIFHKNNLLKRISDVEGGKEQTSLYNHINYEYDDIRANLYFKVEKNNSLKMQYIFINNRLVQDIAIHKTIMNTFQKHSPELNIHNYIIYVTLPPDQVDVNVHPNKTIVKFFEPYKIQSSISSAIKNYISSSKTQLSPNKNQELLAQLEVNEQDSKLNYKSFSFQDQNSLENYFTPSQKKLKDISEIEVIQYFPKVSLLMCQHKLYLCFHLKLLTEYLRELSLSKSELIPLLISQPIKCDRIRHQNLKLLRDLGFDIDLIEDTSFILRGYPSSLKLLNVSQFAEKFLKSEASEISSFIQSFGDEIMTKNFLKDRLSDNNLSLFLKTEVLKELREGDLLQYE